MKLIELLLSFTLQLALELTKLSFQILGVLLSWLLKALGALTAALWQSRQSTPQTKAHPRKRVAAPFLKHRRKKCRKRKRRPKPAPSPWRQRL